MTREDIKTITDIVHKTIYQFFDGGDGEPMSDKDKLLLAVNKAICNNIKALEQEPTTVLQEIREEIRKDAEWWSENDSLREQVLRDVIEEIIDKHIGDTE